VKESRSSGKGTNGEENISTKHRVVEAVDSLRQFSSSDASASSSDVISTGVTSSNVTSAGATSSVVDTSLYDSLTKLQSCCNSSLAERCLAAESGAYPVLMTVLKNATAAPDWTLVSADLECLASLINGHPDVLDEAGTDALLELLRRTEVCK